jgi:RNA polymerase subunit RPABC4/transcription elongation factor Spt4
MAIEDLEYARRKIGAALMIIFGFIIFFVFIVISLGAGSGNYVGAFTIIIFGCCISLFLIIYGSYLWRKVTHVVWTKQAIREMMDKDFQAEQKYLKNYQQNSENKQKANTKTCSSCGEILTEDDIYCPECGIKINSDSKLLTCPNCNFKSDLTFNYCPECGYNIKGDSKNE